MPDLLKEIDEELAEETTDFSVSSVDREALKMMFSEVVDLSIPLLESRSFINDVPT